MTELNIEGSYHLNYLRMSTPKQNFDITPYVSKCDIFESILEPTVVATFVITDRVGLFTHFVFDEQTIEISFNTVPDVPEAAVEYKFTIVKSDPAVPLDDQRGIVYRLVCVSEEAAKSPTIKNIPIIRQNIEAEIMIRNMLEVLESEKNLTVEKTRGLHSFALTRVTPFKAIDMIRSRAISEQHAGSAFVFFENAKGYHFKSIEALIAEGKENIGDKYYHQTTLSHVDFSGSKWRNIIGFRIVQNGNQSVARRIGGGLNTSKQYDLETGEFILYDKRPDMEFVSLNDDSQSSSLTAQQKLSENEGEVSMILYNPDNETNDIGDKANVLPYYLTHFLNIIAHMMVYGDTSVRTGDVITCEIPQYDGLTIEEGLKEPNEIAAGNYLICKCRHMLTFNENAQYLQSLEIVKDGIGGTMPRTRFL